MKQITIQGVGKKDTIFKELIVLTGMVKKYLVNIDPNNSLFNVKSTFIIYYFLMS